jgi:phosphatidylethanolamine-binding protein (PEBP) family uncharacterized protein
MQIKKMVISISLLLSSSVLAQTGLTVDWDWKRAHQCSSTSPRIEVAGIPTEAKSLSISLVDHDARHYDHGGGQIAYDGNSKTTIQEGALKNYKGPCPPNFSSFGHDYEFTVRALGADGQTELARGSRTKTFSASAVKE